MEQHALEGNAAPPGQPPEQQEAKPEPRPNLQQDAPEQGNTNAAAETTAETKDASDGKAGPSAVQGTAKVEDGNPTEQPEPQPTMEQVYQRIMSAKVRCADTPTKLLHCTLPCVLNAPVCAAFA